jgi:hypothetical protein
MSDDFSGKVDVDIKATIAASKLEREAKAKARALAPKQQSITKDGKSALGLALEEALIKASVKASDNLKTVQQAG